MADRRTIHIPTLTVHTDLFAFLDTVLRKNDSAAVGAVTRLRARGDIRDAARRESESRRRGDHREVDVRKVVAVVHPMTVLENRVPSSYAVAPGCSDRSTFAGPGGDVGR
jgi:hypothetical protein